MRLPILPLALAPIALSALAAIALSAPCVAEDEDSGPDIQIHSWQEILHQALHGADSAAAEVTTFAISHGAKPADEVAATLATLHQEIEAVATRVAAGDAVPEARLRAVCDRARAVRDVLGQLKEAQEDRDTAATMHATKEELGWWDARQTALATRLLRVDLVETANDADGELAEAACHHLIVRVHEQVREVQQAQRANDVKRAIADLDAQLPGSPVSSSPFGTPESAFGWPAFGVTGTTVGTDGNDATAAAPATAPAATNSTPEPSPAGQVPGQRYTVVEGDNLASISAKFYGTPRLHPIITRANPGIGNRPLKPGQTVFIPDTNFSHGASATAPAAAPGPDIAAQALAAFDTAAHTWLTRLAAWRAGSGERPGDFDAQHYEEALRLGQQATGLDQQREQTDADRELAGTAELAAYDRIIIHEAAAERALALMTMSHLDGDPLLVAAQAECHESDNVVSSAREALDQAKERAATVRHILDLCAQEPGVGGGTMAARLRESVLRAESTVRAAAEAVTANSPVQRIQAQGESAKASLAIEALRAEADDDIELLRVEKLFAAPGNAAPGATAAAPTADPRLRACRERAKTLAETRAKALELAITKQDVETRLALLSAKQDALGTAVEEATTQIDTDRGLYMSEIQALHQAAEAAAAPSIQKGRDEAMQVPTADPKDGL